MFLAANPVVPNSNPILPDTVDLIIGTVAFLIVFVVLWRVLLPRIQETLKDRTDAIEGGLKRADEAQEKANATLVEYQQQLQEARHEAARLRQQAQEDGAAIIAEMREQAGVEARRLVEAAKAQIEADRAQALQSLRAEVGALAVELASRVVGESLAEEARQRRVVDRFLDELEAQPQAAGRG